MDHLQALTLPRNRESSTVMFFVHAKRKGNVGRRKMITTNRIPSRFRIDDDNCLGIVQGFWLSDISLFSVKKLPQKLLLAHWAELTFDMAEYTKKSTIKTTIHKISSFIGAKILFSFVYLYRFFFFDVIK
jgi:hypothetical protein